MKNQLISLNGSSISLLYDEGHEYCIPETLKEYYYQAINYFTTHVKFDSVRAKPYEITFQQNNVIIKAGPFSYVKTRALQQTIDYANKHFILDIEKDISSISLGIAIISHDGQLLVSKRSEMVGKFKNLWTVVLGEGLEEKDFKNKNLYQSVQRGLMEELHIFNAPNSAIHFLALSADSVSSINILTLVDFRSLGEKYTPQYLLQEARKAEDQWEHATLHFVEPTREAFEEIIDSGVIPNNFEYLSLIQNYLCLPTSE